MNFEKKLIGVAIPTFNRADYLEATLRSVLNQTLRPAQVIVTNDGSTDDTHKILNNYKTKLKIIEIDNSGAGMARKIAAEATDTPWLAFCDSDDIWEPTHLERRAWLLNKYPEVNFSFSDLKPFGPGAIEGKTYFSDAPTGWWEQFPPPDEDNVILMGDGCYLPFLRFNPGSPVTTVMTRELYDRIGGIDPRYSRMAAEDADLCRKAVLHGTVLCDRTVTARQRRHQGNMSGYIVDNLLGKCTILEDHLRLGVAPPSYHAAIREEINLTLHEAFRAAWYAGDHEACFAIAKRVGVSSLSLKDKLRYARVLFNRLSPSTSH